MALTLASRPLGSEAEVREMYRTALGRMYLGRIEKALKTFPFRKLKGRVNLILTSPPFPLVRKKKYGNQTGEAYLKWISTLAPAFADLLTEDGSIVMEIGNAWQEASPEMSTLPLETLLAFKQAANLCVCQQIICHNPARLPSPAHWVNVKRIRLKDSFTHVWWFSRTAFPKADNRKVLTPYSDDMQRLLKRQRYNAGQRPSGHRVSATGFLKTHGGAITPNVLDFDVDRAPSSMLKISGTAWDAKYHRYCKEHSLPSHPARMQVGLASFFIEFLTDKRDLIFDPFAGSNTSGAAAELLGRSWVALEAHREYIEGSKARFQRDKAKQLDLLA